MSLTHQDYATLSAAEIAEAVASGTYSAAEVSEAAIARMELTEPHLHAFCNPAPELARKTAASIDAARAAGEPLGPLAGVPVGIKDLVATKDLVTAMGSTIYRDFLPEDDDIVVERLKAAGAVIIGKTNVPELGYSGVGHNPVFETTRNPWNTELTPGGSSAGSGASVAAGVTPFAIGSDGGGSVRIPSAHCGLVGVKASMGRVPLWPGCRDERFPGVSSWESLEHIGPMARTVSDAALMLSVITGPDMRDRHSIPADVNWLEAAKAGDLPKLRIAFSEDFGYLAVDPEVRRVVREAAAVFERDLGCEVVSTDPGWSDPGNDFWGLVLADSDLAGMRAWLPEHGANMSPHLVQMLQTRHDDEALTNANMARKKLCNIAARFFGQYDLLISPTLTVPPFALHMQGPEKTEGRIVDPSAWLGFCFPFNMTGQPAASVPAGLTSDGLPVGLQIVGRHLDDPLVLRAAAAFETARPWSALRPPLIDMLEGA
ncbi:amidase family protein [Salipiger sp. 1_MG-2023]|uniref:amidase n=1 Tax=Salipiger sp. 1_MG-2023 TaxID=3062665 RepID=UPI0026E124D5|nr:amidase family protein [Salipiger sp. 1_MG-2023]MDO6584676.1 amidase family protein [Salipiger sp. 1_MG-2023]